MKRVLKAFSRVFFAVFFAVMTAGCSTTGWIVGLGAINLVGYFYGESMKFGLTQNLFVRCSGEFCESRCGFYFHEKIPAEKMYRFKKPGFYYFDKFGKVINDGDHFGVFPLESCDKTWCKIYYPCGETEYFVKKDEIEPYVKKAK